MARRNRLSILEETTPPAKELRLDLPVESVTVSTRWLLRLVVRTDARTAVFQRGGMDVDVATSLGLDPAALEDAPNEAIQEVLARWLVRLETTELPLDTFSRNARAIGELLALEESTADVLAFLARVGADPGFGECFRGPRLQSQADLVRYCAAATGHTLASIRAALDRRGPLRSMGLLHSGAMAVSRGRYSVQDKLAELLGEEVANPQDILRIFLRPAPEPKLALRDYAHIDDRLQPLVDVVRGALARRLRGVNILIYGPPGTGKSELTRALAAALETELFEVGFEDEDGDPMLAYQRLCGAAVAQRTLRNASRAMLVFDEIEDVFAGRTPMLAQRPPVTVSSFKAWTHRLMEEASVPTLWIGNSIDEMDPATLRRFDFALELGLPPESRRRELVAAAFAGTSLPQSLVRDLVADGRTTPAHVAQAARIAELVGDDAATQERAVRVALEASLALAGPARAVVQRASDAYDLSFVNASVDLASLTEAIRRKPSASICLFGAPGTGKTAYVHHLARRLDKPLHSLRMSDLLGMYVGETEKRLARAFASAQSAGAVLFLDEIDGLLRDRAGAQRGWEVTQVNELLVQLEGFGGVFVCATNLREALDPASLRRFSVKVEFRPLEPAQRAGLLGRMVGCEAPLPEPVASRLQAMSQLCAGDFAAVRKRLELLGHESDLDAWVRELGEEHAFKASAGARRIGFVA